jgi:hypothetical protein
VYRSQPDLTAVYDPTVSTLPVDYSYGQYPEQMDPGQSFSQYPYTSGYQADNSTWVVAEQRKNIVTGNIHLSFLVCRIEERTRRC